MAPNGRPAFILYVQTFGDLVTFNPHIHALVAGGVFLPSGTFRLLPRLSEASPGSSVDGRRCGDSLAERDPPNSLGTLSQKNRYNRLDTFFRIDTFFS